MPPPPPPPPPHQLVATIRAEFVSLAKITTSHDAINIALPVSSNYTPADKERRQKVLDAAKVLSLDFDLVKSGGLVSKIGNGGSLEEAFGTLVFGGKKELEASVEEATLSLEIGGESDGDTASRPDEVGAGGLRENVSIED
ncbi:hypothetical protein HDU98_005203, partial [Podochytrium sp. JEL0797]